ncbi:MAG TPA: flavodoxin family protein [Patescibacteria group bacterium]|nr:flavodoxin family protein [Patescibacteria group bacterium]
MKVIALVGSPRKNGNTDILLQKVLAGAKSRGAATEFFYMNELNIRGCQGCYGCKKTGKCVVDDDLVKVFTAIDEADAVVLGSPIYFGRFTAQSALFLDRLFVYVRPDFTTSLGSGKKYGLIFTQGQPDATLYTATVESTAKVLERIGFQSGPKPLLAVGLPGVPKRDVVSERPEYLQAAQEIGEQLASR